jgi:ribosome biogenesis GTPase
VPLQQRLANFHKLEREARRDAMTVFERRAQLSMWKARTRAAAARIRAKRS